MQKLFLIDSHALLHRFYHALPPLTTPEGKPIQAIYGLAGVLLRMIRDFKPNYIAAAADTPTQTFRREKFPTYKAHRAPTADDLKAQLAEAPNAFAAFGVKLFRMPGYEADDVIGTLAAAFETGGIHVEIFSGDLDLLQLVRGEAVTVTILKTGLSSVQSYNEKTVVERYGIPPARIPEWKGLVGDPSDNIPGAKGVGPKTARELLTEFGTLEGIYENLSIITPTVAKKLEAARTLAFESRELATIKADLPMEVPALSSLAVGPLATEKLSKYLESLGFASLAAKL